MKTILTTLFLSIALTASMVATAARGTVHEYGVRWCVIDDNGIKDAYRCDAVGVDCNMKTGDCTVNGRRGKVSKKPVRKMPGRAMH